MRCDINGLDRAELLVRLFENAKKSVFSKLYFSMWLVTNDDSDDIKTIDDLTLSKGEARNLLSKSLKLANVNHIAIDINFMGIEIDINAYDQTHLSAEDNDVKSAAEIIETMHVEQALHNKPKSYTERFYGVFPFSVLSNNSAAQTDVAIVKNH